MIEFNDIQALVCDKWLDKNPDCNITDADTLLWALDTMQRYDRLRDTFVVESNPLVEIIGESTLKLIDGFDADSLKAFDEMISAASDYEAMQAMVLQDLAVDGGTVSGIHIIILDGEQWQAQFFYADGVFSQGIVCDNEIGEILEEYESYVEGRGK